MIRRIVSLTFLLASLLFAGLPAFFLAGMRNRVSTMVNWFWAYLTFGGGIRLITGAEPIPAGSHDRPDPRS